MGTVMQEHAGQPVTDEIVELTRKFHSYRIAAGPQFNAGERVRVPKDEADRLVAEGAAVRYSVANSESSTDEKAPAHPTKDKMVKTAQTK